MVFIKRNNNTSQPPVHTRRHTRDFGGLVTALHDSDADVRRWAARDLADFSDSSAALVARLSIEDSVAVREAILVTLTMLGDAVAIEGLVECLRSEDAQLRNEAMEAMKQLPDQVAPIMEKLLNDGDSDVRIFAVNVLESLRHPRVEEWLIHVIGVDAHVNVCATAVDLLGEVGTEQAEPALLALKQRFANEPYVAFAADVALKRIRGG